MPQQDESWKDTLTPNERRAHELREQGLNQEQIGGKMGKSQQTVSRLLASIEGKRRAAQVQQYQATGGA